MILQGFLVFYDPPLTNAREVIQSLKDKGVDIKILTGDNELVAQTLCRQVGIDPDQLILGNTLDAMSDQELMLKAQTTLLFARVMPDQKQRIITYYDEQDMSLAISVMASMMRLLYILPMSGFQWQEQWMLPESRPVLSY